MGEVAETFAEGNFRGESEVALEGGGVCVGGRDVAWLHGDKFFVGFEVVVLGENTGVEEFFLKDLDEVEEAFGLPSADVINGIGRDGETILTEFALRCTFHDTEDALDDVINIGEVAAAITVVEDLDGIAFEEFISEAEVCHIGTTSRTVNGEEAETRGGDIVEFAVAVSKEFVALLGCCIETDGVVYPIVGAERYFLVAAVDTRAGGVDEVLNALVV